MHYRVSPAPFICGKGTPELPSSPKRKPRDTREWSAGPEAPEDGFDPSILRFAFDAPFLCDLITRCAALRERPQSFAMGFARRVRLERPALGPQWQGVQYNRLSKADDYIQAHTRVPGTPSREPGKPSRHWSRRPRRRYGRVHEMHLHLTSSLIHGQSGVYFSDVVQTCLDVQSGACAFLVRSVFSRRKRVAQPSLTVWRLRPIASASAGTSCVITEPEPT
jgi:hypothetical protein